MDPRNWHPITLLNVDCKLDARVIAGRLLKVIHLVVDKDQTCRVPGRFIVKMLLSLVTSLSMPPPLVPWLPSFRLIRRRLSTLSIGVSCVSHSLLWVLAPLLFLGLTFFISVFRALSMLMAIFLPFLVCLGVSGKAVFCLRSSMYLFPKFLWPPSAATPVFPVFVFLILSLCPPSPRMQMILP